MKTITMQLENGNRIKYQQLENGTCYHLETSPALVAALERARLDGTRIKITLGNVETGEAWGDRAESGKLGRSTGDIKVPLLIASRRSMGGGALLDHCIIKVEHANKKQGGIIYQLTR